MSTINDVIKEKFGVDGSNIAETLSKITPGEGGSWLTVNIEEIPNQVNATKLDKTAGEIVNALPFVVFKTTQIYNEDGGSDDYGLTLVFGCRYEHNPNADGETTFLHTFTIDETAYTCSYNTDYPTNASDK